MKEVEDWGRMLCKRVRGELIPILVENDFDAILMLG